MTEIAVLRNIDNLDIRFITFNQALTPIGWWAAISFLPDLFRMRLGVVPPKQKSHRQVSSGGGILELLGMILEYQVPAPEDTQIQQVQQRQARLVFWTLIFTAQDY